MRSSSISSWPLMAPRGVPSRQVKVPDDAHLWSPRLQEAGAGRQAAIAAWGLLTCVYGPQDLPGEEPATR